MVRNGQWWIHNRSLCKYQELSAASVILLPEWPPTFAAWNCSMLQGILLQVACKICQELSAASVILLPEWPPTFAAWNCSMLQGILLQVACKICHKQHVTPL